MLILPCMSCFTALETHLKPAPYSTDQTLHKYKTPNSKLQTLSQTLHPEPQALTRRTPSKGFAVNAAAPLRLSQLFAEADVGFDGLYRFISGLGFRVFGVQSLGYLGFRVSGVQGVARV